MCFPYLSLLWKGVGVYFFFSSLIPSHLSLRSKSFEIASSTPLFLSFFLLFVNYIVSCLNFAMFLSFAALFLFSDMSLVSSGSSNRFLLSLGCVSGSDTVAEFNHFFVSSHLFSLFIVLVLLGAVCSSS